MEDSHLVEAFSDQVHQVVKASPLFQELEQVSLDKILAAEPSLPEHLQPQLAEVSSEVAELPSANLKELLSLEAAASTQLKTPVLVSVGVAKDRPADSRIQVGFLEEEHSRV